MPRSQRFFNPLVVSVLVLLLAGALTIVVPAVRTRILRTAGWALVVDEPVQLSDAAVVTVDAGAAGALEAADLVRGGVATQVAVFADLPDTLAREFSRRNVPYEDSAERSIRLLRSLGVTTVERISSSVAGTEDEGEILSEWCALRHMKSVVVVTSSEHSRRVRRVLHRAMKGHRTKVVVRVARYSHFDPDRWWQTRAGVRTEIIELEKLLLDLARHPIS